MTLKLSIAFISILALTLIGLMAYDLSLCVSLADWYGAALDLFVIAVTTGGLVGLAHAVVREIQWQRMTDSGKQAAK